MTENSRITSKSRIELLLITTAFMSMEAHAAIDNTGVLDNVLARYFAAASAWSAFITGRATWLFWTLALVSMVWTFGLLALRKADIGEFFAEFVRFTIFTGFFWWMLINGPNFAMDIMNSLRSIASNASGVNSSLMPSGIIDIGFDIFFKVLDQSSLWSPIDSATGLFVSATILIVLALIAVNMLLLLVSGWVLAYAGIFFLGFGGARWTSEIAINYYRTVLNIAAQLFTMVLLVGIGKSFVDQYYSSMSAGLSLKELVVMMVVAIVLLALVSKLPTMVGSLSMSGSTHALGNGFGAGAAMGAVTMAGMAIAAGGTAVIGSMSGAARGTNALADAYAKAAAADIGNDTFHGDILAGRTASHISNSSNLNTTVPAVDDRNFYISQTTSSDSCKDWPIGNTGNHYTGGTTKVNSRSVTNEEISQDFVNATNSMAGKTNNSLDSPEAEIAAFVNSKPS